MSARQKGEHDPRYEAADAAIRGAFLDLFEKTPIEQVTVSQIVRASGVNRSTFYAHYTDKYGLLDAIEEDFLQRMESAFESSPTMELLLGEGSDEAAWEAYFTRMVELLYANKQLFAGLAMREDDAFMVRFSKTFAEALKERGAVSRLGIPQNYEAAMLAWATAGLVEEWARGGFADDRAKVVRMLVHVAMSIQDTVLG